MAWLSARSGLRSQHLLQWCRPEPCSDVRTPHVIKAFHGPHAAQSIGGKPVAAPGPLSLLSVPSSCPHSEISSLGQYKHNNGRVSNECIRMGSAASQPKDSGSSTLRGRNRKPAPVSSVVAAGDCHALCMVGLAFELSGVHLSQVQTGCKP